MHAVATLLRLEDRRELDTAAIGSCARSATPEVRRRAYLAAGRLGGAGAAELVRPGLRDPDPQARAAAAFGLGLLRDTTSVDSLARVAFEDGGLAAERAVFALGRMSTPAAHSAVLAVLGLAGGRTDLERNKFMAPTPPVLGQALLAIWRTPRTPRDAPRVAEFTTWPDTALRWRATYALMRLGDPRYVPLLERLLADSSPDVRALAARGLRAVVADSAGRRAQARTALVAALRDSAPHVRISAAGALAGYRDSALVDPLRALLRDADVNVAIAAAQALGVVRHPDGTTPLGTLVASPEAPLALRAAALTSLAQLDPPLAASAAEAWAADTGAAAWRQRLYAAAALGSARWSAAAATVQELARDPDPRVSAAALDAMGALLGDSLAPPRGLIVERLGAADPMVRASAIGVLSTRPQAADLELDLASYARAAADSLDNAALAAVDALAALRKAGTPAARDFFARFPRSRDFVVRRAVAEKLGDTWGPATPVETGRDSTYYLDVVRRLVAPALAGAPGPRVRIRTVVGTPPGTAELLLALDPAEAPLTVDNFLSLARRHYFDGARWHRVVPNFVVQDGDPRGDGNGGPGWAIRDELNELPYLRGVLGMALSGPDTGGSQFFVTLSPQPHLDAGYTVFGHVLSGLDVLDRIVQDDTIQAVEVVP